MENQQKNGQNLRKSNKNAVLDMEAKSEYSDEILLYNKLAYMHGN